MTIESETILLPFVIADCVCREVAHHCGTPTAIRYAARLTKKAEVIYSRNKVFRKELCAEGGRDYLYKFMRHWLAGIMKRRHPAQYRKLPHGFGWSV